MFAQLGTKYAAIHAGAFGVYRAKFRALVGLVLAASLGGCVATSFPLVGADPADPNAKIGGVGYRSSTAPYRAMRPTAPTAWGTRNGSAPVSETDK